MKIAVIGAGISGLGAAWLLSKNHEVHLFEADKRLGGHANTVTVDENGRKVPVDTGFLVYNELTYPNLVGFFKALQVETVDSDMSLSVQVKEKGLEWNGSNLNTVYGQRSNLFNIRFHYMLYEILRFAREAEENLFQSRRHAWTLGDLLSKKKYSCEFCNDYLLPIGAAIWSMPEQQMLGFPAETFLKFFINHRLLEVNNRPIWRTVKNGSINYVNKAASGITKIWLNSGVKEVVRMSGQVQVRTESSSENFEAVILATHAPITARILQGQTERERAVLSQFAYESNQTILHADESYMPKTKRCWASWNVFGTLANQSHRKVSLTYYLNKLQPLQTSKNYFVTLNPLEPIQNPIQELSYDHPQFDQKAIRAQRELPSIQGHGGVYFAGAWSRYGFHEDGLLSAVQVAKLLGAEIPWRQE